MKIRNRNTHEFVRSENLVELDTYFEDTEYLEDGWRMRCYPKEDWIKVDKQKCLEEIANCVNKVTTNTVVEVVEIVNNADTLVMGVLLKEFSKKSLLRYDKEHTRVTIDGWRINDWDHSLRVAIEKYL
mgnify:FL=1|jgi:hypothetical protein